MAMQLETMKEKKNFHQATKEHNRVLLAENSRMHSVKQELPDVFSTIHQLKEDIQTLTVYFKQMSQTFVQEFTLLTEKVQESIIREKKANKDCSSVMCECNKLTEKNNTLLHEIRCLKGKQNKASSLTPFIY